MAELMLSGSRVPGYNNDANEVELDHTAILIVYGIMTIETRGLLLPQHPITKLQNMQLNFRLITWRMGFTVQCSIVVFVNRYLTVCTNDWSDEFCHKVCNVSKNK